MITPLPIAGSNIAVVGLGRNGLPAAHRLAALGASVAVWDDNAALRDAAGLPVHDPGAGYAGFDALVLSPGIPHILPAPHPAAAAARAADVPILSDAELLYRAVREAGSRARFVGITGTNGKSTTTALLAHTLTAAGVPNAAGGNLGTAALALPLLGDDGVYVLEMSSYMLERLATLRFDVAVLLNLSPDHLDRHGSMEGYIAAKRHVFDRGAPVRIVGADDPWSAVIAAELATHAIANAPPTGAGALPGAHNAQNAAAVAAAARVLGVDDATIAAAAQSFPGLAHRQQRVAEQDGVVFINDSKATNADSTARALLCHDRVIWIAGGQAKAGGIDSLRPLLPRVAHAVLIGQDAPLLATTLDAAGVPYTLAGTLDAAVPAARRLAHALHAPAVLLSPACASFDQFTGFEARGDQFAQLVLA